jgi:hypothetical protein
VKLGDGCLHLRGAPNPISIAQTPRRHNSLTFDIYSNHDWAARGSNRNEHQ